MILQKPQKASKRDVGGDESRALGVCTGAFNRAMDWLRGFPGVPVGEEVSDLGVVRPAVSNPRQPRRTREVSVSVRQHQYHGVLVKL